MARPERVNVWIGLDVGKEDRFAEEVVLARPFGELLSTLPGIGPRTGSRILAEIGDGTRFADGARLASRDARHTELADAA